MANAVTTQIILDGPRNVVVKMVALLDTSDIAATNIVTLAGLANPVPTQLRIDRIAYSVSQQLGVQLYWDATTDVIITNLFPGGDDLCFKGIGGLLNNAGSGKTGAIQVVTTGWASGIQGFTLVLELVKT